MKIIRVIARLNVGGPAKHVVWLTAGLQGPDCETLLVTGSVPPGEEDMSYFAAEHGVRPIFFQEMSREISLNDAITIWKLYRLFRRERPDIVHTHTAKAGTVGRLAGFLYRWLTPGTLIGNPRRVVFVHTYHGHVFHSYYGSLKTRLFVFIERALARLTDRIIVVSEQQRREIHKTFQVGREEQFSVIPLGLELNAFSGWQTRRHLFREELGASSDEILVGIVGRLTEVKNHDLFLRGAAEFKSLSKNEVSAQRTRFIVVGDGSLRPQLEARVRSLGLTDDVIFAGNRRDPENFYPALDIVALTSLNEGTPLTLIEAMGNARPVIGTAVGGVVDLLGAAQARNTDAVGKSYTICERGLGIPVDDAETFAAGLARLVSDPQLRRDLGQRGATFVANHHSKERLLADVRELYDGLLSRGTVPVKVSRGAHGGTPVQTKL